MQKSTRLLVFLVLGQLLLPGLKATGLALVRTSWLVATCLFWGPWLLLGVCAGLGWLLRRTLAYGPGESRAVEGKHGCAS